MVYRFIILLAALCALHTSHADQHKVLGVGNVAMDLLLTVESEFLETVGITPGACIDVTEEAFNKLPPPDKITSGGCSANTIKGLGMLGMQTSFFGKRGTDKWGDAFLERLIAHNIDPILIFSEIQTTLIACLITADGQRSMMVFNGAGAHLSEKDLYPQLFADKTLVHLDGYTLNKANLFQETILQAKAQGKLVSVDLGSRENVRHYREFLLTLLPGNVDIIFGNEDEIEVLSGEKDEKGLEMLRQLFPLVIKKIGPQGCIVATPKEMFTSPGIATEVVDTTGAGDLFASGFLYGYLNHCSLETCAYYGNVLGSAAVESYGAEIPSEKWAIIQEKLRAESVTP